MVCTCNIVEIEGAQLKKNLGRAWNLGPVIIKKDPDSTSLSIIGTNETFNNSFINLNEFRQCIMTEGVEIPLKVKFSVKGERGPYGFDPVGFDDQVVCKYKKIVFAGDKIELVLEMLAKGKELSIFNGNSDNGERTGSEKPLFWASILKGNLH